MHALAGEEVDDALYAYLLLEVARVLGIVDYGYRELGKLDLGLEDRIVQEKAVLKPCRVLEVDQLVLPYVGECDLLYDLLRNPERPAVLHDLVVVIYLSLLLLELKVTLIRGLSRT